MSLRFVNPADARRFRVGSRLIEPKRSRLARLWQWAKCRLHREPGMTITRVDYETGEIDVRVS